MPLRILIIYTVDGLGQLDCLRASFQNGIDPCHVPAEADKNPMAPSARYRAGNKGSIERCSGGADTTPNTEMCPADGSVLDDAADNPFALISALREDDSPLQEIRLHPGILEVASVLTDACDSPGIEPRELETLLRIVIYLDRLQRSG
jgi:hypothetical protein